MGSRTVEDVQRKLGEQIMKVIEGGWRRRQPSSIQGDLEPTAAAAARTGPACGRLLGLALSIRYYSANWCSLCSASQMFGR